jgi:hypothetical protein
MLGHACHTWTSNLLAIGRTRIPVPSHHRVFYAASMQLSVFHARAESSSWRNVYDSVFDTQASKLYSRSRVANPPRSWQQLLLFTQPLSVTPTERPLLSPNLAPINRPLPNQPHPGSHETLGLDKAIPLQIVLSKPWPSGYFPQTPAVQAIPTG